MTLFTKIRSKKAQSVMEFGVLILVIAAAMLAMQTYLKRGLQGRLRSGVDSIGDQYDPTATTSDMTIDHISNITTNTTSGAQQVLVGSYWTGWGWQDVYRTVEITTSVQQTHYDNTVKSGYEAVANP